MSERDPVRAVAAGKTETCPICGEPTVHASRPFCSGRCASIDLNRWLSGSYAIPVVEDEDEDGARPGDLPPGLSGDDPGDDPAGGR